MSGMPRVVCGEKLKYFVLVEGAKVGLYDSLAEAERGARVELRLGTSQGRLSIQSCDDDGNLIMDLIDAGVWGQVTKQ